MGKLKEEALGVSAGRRASNPLDAALQRVTHTDCAAVPPEAIEEAISLASESEDALTVVLRHVEDNVSAPDKEWRRINGALSLLEKMLKPGLNGDCLVGRIWYESRMEERLNSLAGFQHDDPRIAGLIKRTASAAIRAADEHIPKESDAEYGVGRAACDSESEKACTGGHDERECLRGGDPAGTGGSGSVKAAERKHPAPVELWNSSDSAANGRATSSEPATLGRTRSPSECAGGADDIEAAMAATRVKYALKTTATRKTSVPSPKRESAAVVSAASNSETARSPALIARNICCFCCRRRSPASEAHANDDELGHLIKV